MPCRLVLNSEPEDIRAFAQGSLRQAQGRQDRRGRRLLSLRPMLTPQEILFTTAVPAGIALLVLLVAWRPWQRARPVIRGHWGAPLAAGLAFLTAYALLDGEKPAWPPAQARHWLFFLAAGLTVLGLLDALLGALLPAPEWLRAEVALVASAALVVRLFASVLSAETWPAPSAVQWIAGMTIAVHVTWVSTEQLARRLPRVAAPLVLLVFTSGVAAVTALSGSLVYGRLAGVLAAVTAVACAVSMAAPAFTLARGGVAVIAPLAVAVLLLGYHLADPGVGAVNGGLLLSALLLPWLSRLRPLRRRRPWVRVTAAVLLALLPVSLAVARAGLAFRRAQQQDSAGDLYSLVQHGAHRDA
jgi:hypothetical protein